MSIEIQEWDKNTMAEYPVITLLGRRRAGKSVMIRDIVYKYFWRRKKYPNVIVISPTAKFNGDYDWLPQSRIVPDFSDDIIDKVFERQKKLIQNDPKGKNECLIIIDDMVADKSNFASANARTLSKCYILARHYKTAFLNATQSLFSSGIFTPAMKTNTDIFIVFLLNNRDDKKSIAENWLNISEDREQGLALLHEIPNDEFRVLIIDNTKITSQYEEFVFYYKADIIPKNFKYKFDWY